MGGDLMDPILNKKIQNVKADLETHKSAYASYLESELGQEHIIQILPNGVKNEIKASESKFIKRLSDNKQLPTSGWAYSGKTNDNNFHIIKLVTQWNDITVLPADWGSGDFRSETTFKYSKLDFPSYVTNGFTNLQAKANTKSIVRFYNAPVFYLVIPNTEYTQTTDNVGANAYVVSNHSNQSLYYQLAAPIEILLPTNMTPNTLEIVRLSELVNKKANIAQEAWITPTLQNTYASVLGYPVGYYKDDFGVVHLKGRVGTGTAGTIIFTLPVGYRPSADIYIICAVDNGSSYTRVKISAIGGQIYTGTYVNFVDLASISFAIV